VEISPLDQEDREHPAGHDRYQDGTFSGIIDATLIVATPLHVGSGELRMTDNPQLPLVREMTRFRGRPAIPASTLKGLIRSTVEAISRSCVRITRARWHQLPEGAAPCRKKENLCIACRMFGSLGYQGLVRLSDAVLGGEYTPVIVHMPSLYRPRNRAGVYYKGGGKVKGRKVYQHGQPVTDANTPVEAIRPESKLSFQVQFDNLTEAQVGLLLTGMGVGKPPLVLKVGGGKPACYGSVLATVDKMQVWGDAQDLYESYDVEPDDIDLDKFLEAAQTLIVPEQLERLAELLTYNPQRECPAGVY
jgi:hypothetical protein